MRERLNKPITFLSHSAKDKSFIERLAVDLRKCQIEPWLDTEVIRDGEPWLKTIFEYGIPTCDAVIVYFTDNSLHSKMVAKEIDAALVEQLSEKDISFLPYVARDELRTKLRPDLRSLQCRVWNESNYSDILPSVAAEIWRGYLKRTVKFATLEEKNKRLELEKELQRIHGEAGGSIFTAVEDKEFEYLRKMLDKPARIAIPLFGPRSGFGGRERLGDDNFMVQWLHLVTQCIEQNYEDFSLSSVIYTLRAVVESQGYPKDSGADEQVYEVVVRSDAQAEILPELKAYGLVKSTLVPTTPYSYYRNQFADKMYRFKYWLGYNNLLPEVIPFEYTGRTQE